MTKFTRYYNIKTHEELSNVEFKKAAKKGEIDIEDYDEFNLLKFDGGDMKYSRLTEKEYQEIKEYLKDHWPADAVRECHRSRSVINRVKRSKNWKEYKEHRSDPTYFTIYKLEELKITKS